MDLFDKLALWGRRYEHENNPRTGEYRFELGDLLLTFDRNTILELTPVRDGSTGDTVRPDPVRKLKISLLDEGLGTFKDHAGGWYEVYRTGPSGDLSRVRVLLFSPEGKEEGEVRMLVAQRNPDLYFREDPIFSAVEERETARQTGRTG